LEKGVSYTEKVDVYSFGVVVWEMLTKGIPYQFVLLAVKAHGLHHGSCAVFCRGEDNISRAIAAGERPPIPLDCPDFFRKLISKCWLQVPEKRPSFEQIVDYLSRWQKLECVFVS
jgi:serine/threonine protein kinase